jgi:plastocyanin
VDRSSPPPPLALSARALAPPLSPPSSPDALLRAGASSSTRARPDRARFTRDRERARARAPVTRDFFEGEREPLCRRSPLVPRSPSPLSSPPPPKKNRQASASLAKVAQVAGVAASSLLLTAAANAATIKLGADSGALVFDPASVTVAAGEEITFVNNAGFPHNIVFDEDEVPAGVNAEALSREDYLNAPGEKYTVKLSEKGTYSYYCEPHRGAGMQGKITVN